MKNFYPVMYAVIITAFFAITAFAKDYKGAEYRTKEAFTYGRFEARIKSSEREGMLTSFFTYHEYSTGGSENWNEIDIEILGRYSNDVQFNVISPGQINHVRHETVNFNPALDYHTYAFEWTPAYVAWFIDGAEVYRQTGAHITALNKAQKLMMNIWNQNYPDWSGTFNPQTLPAFAYYDWTQYASYTPGAGNTGTGNNFTFQWKDDFSNWNQSRWEKATHTFDGNLCDFIHANAVFVDSALVLCLTNSINTGYTDKNPPVALWARHDSTNVIVRFGEEVDKTSAEDLSNYTVAGVILHSAALAADKKTVTITTSGLAAGSTFIIVVKGVKDLMQPANVMASKTLLINNPPQWAFPIKINIGGPAALGYMADQGFAAAAQYGYLDGTASVYSSTIQIANTSDDVIFLTDRYSVARYFVRVPNGEYYIKLLFAENYYTSPDKRVFDVFINGTKSIAGLDIFKAVGKNAALTKIVNNVVVTNQLIEIGFGGLVDNALIDGLIIEKVTTGVLEGNKGRSEPTYILEQNYPNPFNPATNITYRLHEAANVRLKVFSNLGEQIAEPVNQFQQAGEYSVVFPSGPNSPVKLSTGCYFYKLTVGNLSTVKKMIVLN
ncbi:MAG: family 16 glycosylhydrolase [Ignavibacteriales bacterium]|nr:family 16 glycosylhydrolase [Ignavibacteriales bacterium]